MVVYTLPAVFELLDRGRLVRKPPVEFCGRRVVLVAGRRPEVLAVVVTVVLSQRRRRAARAFKAEPQLNACRGAPGLLLLRERADVQLQEAIRYGVSVFCASCHLFSL